MFALGFTTSVKASPDIIHVPSDYAKIQWAIGNASAGDTIIVSSGTYYEHITIDRSLTLQAENGGSIIDGNGTDNIVVICANNVNISGFTIQNSGPDSGNTGVCLYNSSWCNISHNIITHNGHGIWLTHCSDNNIVAGNNISYNLIGIGLSDSHDNVVTSNYVFSSTLCGIALRANNNILNSNIARSNEYGIWLINSTNVTITGNTMVDNLYGIHLNNSSNDMIFHNNIINNIQQTEIINSTSIWDADFEGNYWNNHDGLDTDKDGIANNPYIIDANNTDNYPLMGTFSDFTINWEEKLHHVTTICNSTISDFQFNGTAICFNVTGEDGTPGFCRIRIPTALMNDTFTVYVDGVNTTYTLLPRSNATYSYLYFTYNHSTKEVIIIPEFPLTLLLYLLMTLTLAATAYSKKKKKCSQNSTL
jgi:parallel beta-helix repeat protein